MVKCANDQCENHGKKLNTGIESCPVCGTQTEKYKAPAKTDLGVGAAIVSLIAILIFWGTSFWWSAPFIAAGCIVVAFISRTKPAVVITFISLAAIIALFINVMILN